MKDPGGPLLSLSCRLLLPAAMMRDKNSEGNGRRQQNDTADDARYECGQSMRSGARFWTGPRGVVKLIPGRARDATLHLMVSMARPLGGAIWTEARHIARCGARRGYWARAAARRR